MTKDQDGSSKDYDLCRFMSCIHLCSFVFIPIRCYGEFESRVLWRLQPPADEKIWLEVNHSVTSKFLDRLQRSDLSIEITTSAG